MMPYLTRFAFLTVISIFFCGLSVTEPAQAQSSRAVSQQVPLIEPVTLHALIKSGVRVYILDVRQPEEFNQGHIERAVLIPLGTLAANYTTLPKTGKLVVYCRSGHRSSQAVQFLLNHGYRNAVSLAGGYTAWTTAGY
jgi:rhodanese-related sulfurtransferase